LKNKKFGWLLDEVIPVLTLSYPQLQIRQCFRPSGPFLRRSVGFYRLLAAIIRRTDDVFRYKVDSFRHLVDLLHHLDGSFRHLEAVSDSRKLHLSAGTVLLYAVKLAPSAERLILFFSAKGSCLIWKNYYSINLTFFNKFLGHIDCN